MDTKAKHVPVNLEHVLFYKLHGCHHPDLNDSNITNGKQSRKQKVAVWNAAEHYMLRGIVIVTCLFNLKKFTPTSCNTL